MFVLILLYWSFSSVISAVTTSSMVVCRRLSSSCILRVLAWSLGSINTVFFCSVSFHFFIALHSGFRANFWSTSFTGYTVLFLLCGFHFTNFNPPVIFYCANCFPLHLILLTCHIWMFSSQALCSRLKNACKGRAHLPFYKAVIFEWWCDFLSSLSYYFYLISPWGE